MSVANLRQPLAAPSAWRALASHNYRLFFFGQAISLVGTWMQTVGQSWLVYRLTGSAALLGLVGFCNQAPVFFLAPLGGAFADRVARRSVLVGTQTASMALALTLGIATLTGHASIPLVIALAALLGVVFSFDLPARQALAGELVAKDDLANAIALNSSIVNGARVVGPAIAGLVVAAIGEGWCFVANAVSFVPVIAGLLAMRGLPRRPRAAASAGKEIAEGFRFAARTPRLRALLLLLAAGGLFAMPHVVLLPALVNQALGRGASMVGWFMSATGLGAFAAAIVLARRANTSGLERWMGRGAIGFGLSLVAFSASRHPALSCALLVVTGFSMMVQLSGTNALVQTMSPDVLRGRVMSIYAMLVMGVTPFGALVSGAFAARAGVPLALALGGLGCALSGALFERGRVRARFARVRAVQHTINTRC